jgi:hypothetical protein
MRRLNLSDIFADHSAGHNSCGHSYKVKKGGQKEQLILSSDYEENGGCSVCWKLYNTPSYLRNRALALVEEYLDEPVEKYDPPKDYAHYYVEKKFYTWLYREFNEKY